MKYMLQYQYKWVELFAVRGSTWSKWEHFYALGKLMRNGDGKCLLSYCH